MISEITETVAWFDNKNVVIGYYDNAKNKHVAIGDTDEALEMIVGKLNEMITELNKLGGKE